MKCCVKSVTLPNTEMSFLNYSLHTGKWFTNALHKYLLEAKCRRSNVWALILQMSGLVWARTPSILIEGFVSFRHCLQENGLYCLG